MTDPTTIRVLATPIGIGALSCAENNPNRAVLTRAHALLNEFAAHAEQMEIVRTGIEHVIAQAVPRPPGGQQVSGQLYQMTISTAKELRRLLALLAEGDR